MKTFFCILLYFLIMFALAARAEAKHPTHTRSRDYYARQYRKVCRQRCHRPQWPVDHPQRY